MEEAWEVRRGPDGGCGGVPELPSIPGSLPRLSSDRASSRPKGACRPPGSPGSGCGAGSLRPVGIGDYQREMETASYVTTCKLVSGNINWARTKSLPHTPPARTHQNEVSEFTVAGELTCTCAGGAGRPLLPAPTPTKRFGSRAEMSPRYGTEGPKKGPGRASEVPCGSPDIVGAQMIGA